MDETPDLLPGDQRTCSSERSTGALKCGRSEAGRAAQSKMAAIVTTLSHQLGANQGSRQGTPRYGFCWSDCIESYCETNKFGPCPTGGQMVAGSNPVSPTSVSLTRVIAAQSTNGACVGCRSDTGRGKYGNPIKTPRPVSDRWRRPFRSGSGECR